MASAFNCFVHVQGLITHNNPYSVSNTPSRPHPISLQVLFLLIEAWRRRLTFTVGQSVTTGSPDSVVWNEIHHKTNMDNAYGHGYPDPKYLGNVRAELALQGVELWLCGPNNCTCVCVLCVCCVCVLCMCVLCMCVVCVVYVCCVCVCVVCVNSYPEIVIYIYIYIWHIVLCVIVQFPVCWHVDCWDILSSAFLAVISEDKLRECS